MMTIIFTAIPKYLNEQPEHVDKRFLFFYSVKIDASLAQSVEHKTFIFKI